jgi:lysophospholipase L1-like esterase
MARPPVRPLVRTVTGLLAAALAVTATGAPTASAQVSAAQTRAVGYQEYVALGDSFSAGPLVPQQRPDAVGCLRSTNNYPAFLATYFSLTRWTDVTCSGAETGDMRNRQRTIVPGPAPAPQLDALSPSTDLVTLGIGGNDFGLFGSMISTCEEVRSQDPDGAPCRKHFTVDGVDTKKRDARRIQPRVGRVVRQIKRRSPEADVFVVGYPRLLPRRGTCDAVPFAKGDYRWGNAVERILNRSIRRAAENNGATYIDLYPASAGHHACAGDQAWINGSEIKPLRAANFHPFLRGMRGMSRAAYRQMTGEHAPAVRLARRFSDPMLPPLDAQQLGFLAGLLQEQLEK